MRLTRSWSIWSAVEITRELAWKPRCAVIMAVNSEARSTFDISIAPAVVVPKTPFCPGVPTVSEPAFEPALQRLLVRRSRPFSFGNFASEM